MRLLLLGLCWLFISLPLAAQDEELPDPQFLYRDENGLILVNGRNGDSIELPLEITTRDLVSWSPDGQYLMIQNRQESSRISCLNLYHVDALTWVYDEPISCDVLEAQFSEDSTRIAFTTRENDVNGATWLHTLADERNELLFQTTEGTQITPMATSGIRWSPTDTYIVFVAYTNITGGTLNHLVTINAESRETRTLYAPDTYYASYNPIWSENDQWFLIRLQEENVTSGALPVTNHRGDLYLVNAESGISQRLTYTPAASEINIHWTEEGDIAFTMVVEEQYTYTLDEAMNIEPVSPEDIVYPEEVDVDEFIHDPLEQFQTSPDSSIGIWVSSPSGVDEQNMVELNIGYIAEYEEIYTTLIPESYEHLLIGWRPMDEG